SGLLLISGSDHRANRCQNRCPTQTKQNDPNAPTLRFEPCPWRPPWRGQLANPVATDTSGSRNARIASSLVPLWFQLTPIHARRASVRSLTTLRNHACLARHTSPRVGPARDF